MVAGQSIGSGATLEPSMVHPLPQVKWEPRRARRRLSKHKISPRRFRREERLLYGACLLAIWLQTRNLKRFSTMLAFRDNSAIIQNVTFRCERLRESRFTQRLREKCALRSSLVRRNMNSLTGCFHFESGEGLMNRRRSGQEVLISREEREGDDNSNK